MRFSVRFSLPRFDVRDRDAFVRLIGVQMLVFMAVGTSAPLMVRYVGSLEADTTQTGLVFATFQVATLVSQYAWGRRSDQLGRRKPLLLIGTLGLAVSLALTALVPWYGYLFIIRIIEGLSMAAYQSGSLAMIGDLLEHEPDRGRLMGTYRMFGSLAFAGAALAGGIVADVAGLRAAVALTALGFGLAALLVLRVRESAPAAAPRVAATTTPLHSGIDTAVLWPFLIVTMSWFLGMGSVATFWPQYMADNGYVQWQISGLWALAALGEVPCLYLAGLLADRFGRKWVLVTGVAGMASVYLAYTVSTAIAWILPVQLIRSFVYSCFEIPSLTYTTELGLRERRGRLAGLFYTANGGGGIIGSALGGALAQASDLVTLFRTASGVMWGAALFAAWRMPDRRRQT